MMKFIYFFICFLLANCPKINAFDNLLFKPLTANHLEARIGCFYQDAEKLRLDIGHSLDFYEFISTKDLQIRAGGDFFILSRLRSEGRMKFPVETSDFYFGLNGSANLKLFEKDFSARLRIAHISSHLVDGYTYQKNDTTFFRKEPFVYSREFVDLVLAYNSQFFRPYIKTIVIFSTIPKNINRFAWQVGFDFNYPLLFVNSPQSIELIGGYDFNLNGADDLKNVGCNSLQAGILLNLSKNVGISLNYYYYSGYSIHGMFYSERENYNGFGVQVHY